MIVPSSYLLLWTVFIQPLRSGYTPSLIAQKSVNPPLGQKVLNSSSVSFRIFSTMLSLSLCKLPSSSVRSHHRRWDASHTAPREYLIEQLVRSLLTSSWPPKSFLPPRCNILCNCRIGVPIPRAQKRKRGRSYETQHLVLCRSPSGVLWVPGDCRFLCSNHLTWSCYLHVRLSEYARGYNSYPNSTASCSPPRCW